MNESKLTEDNIDIDSKKIKIQKKKRITIKY